MLGRNLSFNVEYLSDSTGNPVNQGDFQYLETLNRRDKETENQFECRVIDFVNSCSDPLTKIEDLFEIEDLNLPILLEVLSTIAETD